MSDTNFIQEHPYEILVVDDNKLAQKIIGSALLKLGYIPLFAIDGEDAVVKVNQYNIDIIFMDVEMPNMNGIDATEKIRMMELDLQPYIIATTGHDVQIVKTECLCAGMNEFLPKPMKPSDIKGAIVKYTETLAKKSS